MNCRRIRVEDLGATSTPSLLAMCKFVVVIVCFWVGGNHRLRFRLNEHVMEWEGLGFDFYPHDPIDISILSMC